MKKLTDKLNKGFSNIFSIKPINIAIVISLLIILVLSYKTSHKIDLFNVGGTETPANNSVSTIPITTLSAIEKQNKLISSGSLLQEFIAKLNGQTFNANKFQTILNQRQNMINKLQTKQNELKTLTNNAVDILNID